jgi:tetratricopeptide (TPR) repeat protein
VERDKLIAQVQVVQRYVRSGQLKKAVPEMERLVQAEPNDIKLRLELADLHARAAEPHKAVEQLLTVARRYEKDSFGLKAMGCYLQVMKLEPNQREAALALGHHYSEHGLYAEAARCFDRALASSKSESERLTVIQKLLELDPDNLGDRVRLAEAFSAQGQLQEAARELRKVADVLEHKAGDQDYPRVAERLLYHQPDDANVAKRLAAIYVAQDEPQRALPKLKKAYESRPEDLEVLSLLADTFGQLGQVHKSVAVLKEMARIYDSGGLVHERDECWQKVLTLDPNDPQAREVLGTASQEAVGQTFEVPYHSAPLPSAKPARDPGAGKAAKADKAGDDFDDFDDFEGDEVGFGGTAENTIVDDAYLPDDLREEIGVALTLPGAPSEPPPASSTALQEDLRELDFYIGNGLLAEAEAHLKELGTRHGADNPLLDRRAQQLAKMKPRLGEGATPAGAGGEGTNR